MDKKRMGYAFLVGAGLAACSSDVTGAVGDAMIEVGAAMTDGSVVSADDADVDADLDAWIYTPTIRTEIARCEPYDTDYGGSAGIGREWFARTSASYNPDDVRSVSVRLSAPVAIGDGTTLRCLDARCPPDGAPPLVANAVISAVGQFDESGRLFVSCGRSTIRGEPAAERGYRYDEVSFEITE
jgi:hypothetical protein